MTSRAKNPRRASVVVVLAAVLVTLAALAVFVLDQRGLDRRPEAAISGQDSSPGGDGASEQEFEPGEFVHRVPVNESGTLLVLWGLSRRHSPSGRAVTLSNSSGWSRTVVLGDSAESVRVEAVPVGEVYFDAQDGIAGVVSSGQVTIDPDEVASIRITGSGQAVYRVAGRAVRGDGVARDLALRLRSQSGSFAARAGSSGEFCFPEVVPGEYVLDVGDAALPIVWPLVVERDIEDLQVDVPIGALTVSVIAEDVSCLDDAIVQVTYLSRSAADATEATARLRLEAGVAYFDCLPPGYYRGTVAMGQEQSDGGPPVGFSAVVPDSGVGQTVKVHVPCPIDIRVRALSQGGVPIEGAYLSIHAPGGGVQVSRAGTTDAEGISTAVVRNVQGQRVAAWADGLFGEAIVTAPVEAGDLVDVVLRPVPRVLGNLVEAGTGKPIQTNEPGSIVPARAQVFAQGRGQLQAVARPRLLTAPVAQEDLAFTVGFDFGLLPPGAYRFVLTYGRRVITEHTFTVSRDAGNELEVPLPISRNKVDTLLGRDDT